MNQEKIVDVIHESQSGFVNYVLSLLELALDEKKFKRLRGLVLDRHNDALRELGKKLGTGC